MQVLLRMKPIWVVSGSDDYGEVNVTLHQKDTKKEAVEDETLSLS